MIRTICQEGHNSYSTGRIKTMLDSQGMIISRRRTARLMKEVNLVFKTKRKFRATTDSHHKVLSN